LDLRNLSLSFFFVFVVSELLGRRGYISVHKRL
jgi:hypothetical protein